MIPFPFNENRFSFFVADNLLVGQLCTNPKSDRSLLSGLKVTQCSTSEIGDAPLYNSWSLPIQVMTTAPSKCKSGLPRITGMCAGWWNKVSGYGYGLWCSFKSHIMPPHIFEVGLKVQREPGLASEGVLRLCTLLSLDPSSPDLNPLDYFVWSYVENITNMTFHNTKASLIVAICRVFAELLVLDPYRGGDWGWRRLHWIDVSSTT